jgi:hypothetical protein
LSAWEYKKVKNFKDSGGSILEEEYAVDTTVYLVIVSSMHSHWPEIIFVHIAKSRHEAAALLDLWTKMLLEV